VLPTDGSWSTEPPLPMGPRQECGVAALDGEIYVVGGFTVEGLTSLVEVYDPASGGWRTAQTLPGAMAHHPNLAAVAGQLYVAGSLTGLMFDVDPTTWSYDPATDAWTERTPMPAGSERGAAATVALDGKIFVIGGLRAGAAVPDAWTYDPGADDWAPLPPLPSARDHLVGAAIGGKVYAVGGRSADIGTHVPAVDIYDPATGEWATGAEMPTSRGGAMGAVVGDWLFVGGGEGNAADPETGVFGQWEVYDATTDTWSALPDMPTPRHGSGAAAVGDVIYIPGGATVQAFGAVETHEAWTVGG
jgi:N-acetylneuraminic acid mutarotase